MSAQFRLLMLALDDSRALLLAGDADGAAELRTAAERDYLRSIHEPQLELEL